MSSRAVVDRETTPPFLLRLFYRANNFPSPSDFSPRDPLPPHLQIYTWTSCTLEELTSLLASALPDLLPDPQIGTRVAFRLIFPDMRSAGLGGRYLAKDLGSVVIGASNEGDQDGDRDERINGERAALIRPGPRRAVDDEAEKTLADAQFVIGDYVACVVLPPLEDGAVAPQPPPVSSNMGGGRGPPPAGPRENGFGPRRGGRGGGYGRPDRYGDERGGGGFGRDNRDDGMPSGEWRRGERVPDEPRYGGGGGYRGRGRGRGGW